MGLPLMFCEHVCTVMRAPQGDSYKCLISKSQTSRFMDQWGEVENLPESAEAVVIAKACMISSLARSDRTPRGQA
jgi:hypothetical protein